MPTESEISIFNAATLAWDKACEEYDSELKNACIGGDSAALNRALLIREIASHALELAGLPFEK